ncbi:FAD-dependent oxidoreductase [Streptosporangium sp. DT93]|uniref:FAD-dependent oxidoreductase n=1 Tax=Streptosporangium sp. DT93 TaxID=3393428 RepID=UPI003CEC21A2
MNFTTLERPPASCDVLIVGSGAAGLTAACRAADAGHRVLVVERAAVLGGTTAVSGGVIWAPGNHLADADADAEADADVTDDAGDDATDAGQGGSALRHLVAVTRGSVPRARIEWFLRTVEEAVRYLCDETHVDLFALERPDYRADLPGARRGGRALDNRPFDVAAYPGLEGLLRPPTYLPWLTMAEREQDGGADLAAIDRDRRERGTRTMGGALAGALAVSARARGVDFLLGARAVGLERSGHSWDLTLEHLGRVTARRAVVLASGGFEWDPALQRAFLPSRLTPIGAPGNEGDGLLMALRSGAAVTDLTASWGVPVFCDPEVRYEGLPTGRLAAGELTRPGSIMVDGSGRRFADEAGNYHDLTKVFRETDPATGAPRHVPAWFVYDAGHRARYPVAGTPPGGTPSWAITRPTPRELARACDIDAEALAETIAEFNAGAVAGADRRFGRAPASLAPLAEGPFTAIPVVAGTLGTCGGVVTDDHGRVLTRDGTPVEGLFAAGNVAATVLGDHYPGGGTSLAVAVARAYAIGAALGEGARH